MRLIDADKLNEFVYEDAYGCKCVSMYDIDAQPTAYDVDAVVKQLDNERRFWDGAYDYCIGKEKTRSYAHAIEIVKGGGVDAKTDS